jgi:hypothetical protein
LPKEQKSRKKYQAMTGEAIRLIKEEKNIEAVIELLSHNNPK